MENKKNFYIDGKWVTPKSNQEIKVMRATANMTPGIAYPDMEKVVKYESNLLLETLLP